MFFLAACIALIAMSMPVDSKEGKLIATGWTITFNASDDVFVREDEWMFPEQYPGVLFEHFAGVTVDGEQFVMIVRIFNNSSFDVLREINPTTYCREALEGMGASNIAQFLIAGQDATFFWGIVSGKEVYIGIFEFPSEHQKYIVIKYTGNLEGFSRWLEELNIMPSERLDLSIPS
jgi:hypothetical protein